MKSGESALLPLIDQRVSRQVDGLKALYRAVVIKLDPLTVQPLSYTKDGKKQPAVRDIRRLNFGRLELGNEVLVGVIADGTPNYKSSATYRADPFRQNIINSSVILGVIV
ncbi:hypothetical protein LZY01_19720 [Levilactobacillus zymae]|uniref:Uncharacterized protein n=1 Tax=Levilactobacillus zymae TaxID=267363 RepID=A0ABQ0WY51_9LACO|nr:hypothetical protein LZY01_19720 [Levilactobacillus zymae]